MSTETARVDQEAEARLSPRDTATRVRRRTTPTTRRRLLVHVSAIGIMVVAAVAATWPLGASLATAVPLNLIDSMEATWIFGWVAHALGSQPWNLFDGNIFHPAGLTLAFAENLVGVAALVSPVYLFTGNVVLTANVAYLLLLATSGYGTALLVKEISGAWAPAIVAGAAVAAAPYEVFNLPHTHVVATHLIPFILLVLLRSARLGPTIGRTAALAALLALQFWSSLTGGTIAVVAAAAWGGVLLIGAADRRRLIVHALAAGLAAAVLVAPLGLIYRQVQHDHPEYQRHPSEVLLFAVEPRSYLAPATGGGIFNEKWNELRDEFGAYPEHGWERWLFPGIWLALAGLVGAVVQLAPPARRRRSAMPPTVLASVVAVGLAGFLMTLGPRWKNDPDGLPMPFLVVNKLIPGADMRVPGRFAVLVILALAVAGGCALALANRRLRAALVVASIALLAAETVPARYPIAKAPPITAAHTAVASTDGAVLHLPTYELDERGFVGGPSLIREPIQMYFSTSHFRPVINGYAAFIPTRTLDVLASVQDFPSERGLRALRELDVQTVVVQTAMVPATPWADVVQRLEAWPGVERIASANDVRVYDISAAEPTGVPSAAAG